MVPFLPESWQRCLGLRQWGFPPAQLHEPEPLNAALDEAAAAAPALDADAGPPAEEADAAAPAGNVLAGAAAEDADADDLPAAEDADAPAPAEGEPAALVVPEEKDEGSPAEWSWRFGLLAKKVTGNAARCCVSLGAASLGAALYPDLHKLTVLTPAGALLPKSSAHMLLSLCRPARGRPLCLCFSGTAWKTCLLLTAAYLLCRCWPDSQYLAKHSSRARMQRCRHGGRNLCDRSRPQ